MLYRCADQVHVQFLQDRCMTVGMLQILMIFAFPLGRSPYTTCVWSEFELHNKVLFCSVLFNTETDHTYHLFPRLHDRKTDHTYHLFV